MAVAEVSISTLASLATAAQEAPVKPVLFFARITSKSSPDEVGITLNFAGSTTAFSAVEASRMDTKGRNVVLIEVLVVVLRATCSMDVCSYPPSETTEEQICFMDEALAVAAVLVISYLTGKIAVVM
jgi:hypothetical protein